MLKKVKFKYDKRILYILLFLVLLLNDQIFFETKNIEKVDKISQSLKVYKFQEIFHTSIKNNSILIYEPNTYHYECTPGYCKYFVDMGYNVDILMHTIGVDSLVRFEKQENLRLFTYTNKSQIISNYENLYFIIKKYNYILVQTTDNKNKNIFEKLKLLYLNNTIFVCHYIKYARKEYTKFFEKNRIWTLGNISKGIQVNPHYFGNIKIQNKNYKTKFFLTSTKNRNYSELIQTVIKLKKEKYNFEIIILGWKNHLSFKNIPESINDIFVFKYHVSYFELYQTVEKSDYIIIPLDPNNNLDNYYRTLIVTGSMQLAYGFLKPVIINKEFSDYYFLNNKNSILYNNSKLYEAMKIAINLNENEYKNLQKNLNMTVKMIEMRSINNIYKVISKL